MGEHTIDVTDASFEREVLKAGLPVLVDFWAGWCGPCKQVAPLLDQLAADFKGKLVVAKLDIDDNPNTPGRYGVRGIPTMILFKNGQIEATKVGAMQKSKLVDWVSTCLSS